MSSSRLASVPRALLSSKPSSKLVTSSLRSYTYSSALPTLSNRLPATRISGMRITTSITPRRMLVRGLSTASDQNEKDAPVESPVDATEPVTATATPEKETTGDKNGSSKDEKKEKTELEKLKEEKEDLISRLRYLQADLANAQRIARLEKEKMKDFAIVKFAEDLLQTVDTLEMALKSAKSQGVTIDDHTSSETSSDTSSGTSSGTSTSTSASSTSLSSSSSSSSSSDSDSPWTPSQQSTQSESESQPLPITTATKSSSALLEGINLTRKQLLQTLVRHHIKPFTPTGEIFDPNWCEALFEVPLPVAEGLDDLKKILEKKGQKLGPGIVVDTYKVGYKIKDRCLRAAQVGVVADS